MIKPLLKPSQQPRKRKEPVKVYRDGREVCQSTTRGRVEYASRIIEMWERQEHYCCICDCPLRLSDATFEHEDLRGMGGGRRDDRVEDAEGNAMNGAAHSWCNAKKGSKREA